MKPTDSMSLLSQVRDLQVIDCNEKNCGIVDDVELEEENGKLKIVALLIGPGAYSERTSHWLFTFITKIFGSRLHRVAWSDVDKITSAVQLKIAGDKFGIFDCDKKARKLLPPLPAIK